MGSARGGSLTSILPTIRGKSRTQQRTGLVRRSACAAWCSTFRHVSLVKGQARVVASFSGIAQTACAKLNEVTFMIRSKTAWMAVLLSASLLSVLGTSAGAAGTTPLPGVAQQKGARAGVLHLAATLSCAQQRARCLKRCGSIFGPNRPDRPEGSYCRSECFEDYRACMGGISKSRK